MYDCRLISKKEQLRYRSQSHQVEVLDLAMIWRDNPLVFSAKFSHSYTLAALAESVRSFLQK